ncbi:MAG: class I SAM-dependent methyltransferase [Trebonia sp.]
MEEVYGSGFSRDELFEEALEQSLQPRGEGLLFDLVAQLGLPPGSTALDVGCREAFHCIQLARRFGFTVHGIEPVRRHLDNAAHALDSLARSEPGIAARVRITESVAERLPEPDAAIDLIWCRDMLEHIQELQAAFREFCRVLRPGGHVIIFHVTATEWLTPAEAARLWAPLGAHAASMDPRHLEASIAGAGLAIDQCIELHGEWREYAEERELILTSEQLVHVSRLLRNRAAYEERFGPESYETILSNCLWGIYQMIGKLNPRIYVLSRQA